jgi:hypothetical protein
MFMSWQNQAMKANVKSNSKVRRNPPATRAKPAIHRPTEQELEERIVVTSRALCRGLTKHEIKRAITSQYRVGWRTVETYLSRARALLIEESGRTRQQLVAEAFGFYNSVLSSNASTADKIRARERIDRLFGLDAPMRQEIAGAFVMPAAPKANAKTVQFDYDGFNQLTREMFGMGNETIPAEKAIAAPPPQPEQASKTSKEEVPATAESVPADAPSGFGSVGYYAKLGHVWIKGSPPVLTVRVE